MNYEDTTMKTLNTTATALMIAAGMMMGGNALAGDNCKNFKIKIDNQSNYQVKVTKVEYYDYDKTKWRKEALLQQVLQDNVLWNWTRNLEHVDNDHTKFKVSFKEKYGGAINGYSHTMYAYSNKFTCRDNGSKTITLR